MTQKIKSLELCDVLKDGVIILKEIPLINISEENRNLPYEIKHLGLIKTEDGEIIEIENAIETKYDGEIYHKEYALYEGYTGNYYSPNTPMFPFVNNTKISLYTVNEGVVTLCYHNRIYIPIDDAAFCEDIQDYVHKNYCFYSEFLDQYFYKDKVSKSHCIEEYHKSSYPRDLNDGLSPFSIGFEIEKTDFFGKQNKGDEVGEYELFKGFELDSSCGVEAITNILPLSSSNKDIEEYVFTLFDKSSEIINSDYDNSCGGHITISAKLYNGYELFDKLRSSLAIFYALYRYRLNGNYCNENKSAKRENNTKYSPIYIKNNLLEIRLPNAVKNVEQLKLRYKLTGVIVEHCLQTNDTFEKLLNKITPILKEMYNDNENKIEFIKSLSKDFWKYLNIEEISQKIKEFVK